ncbi:NDP-hexose 2,3-dehydratase family protein [Kitasatospora sp. NPDC048239]|uniref:NDP-hexose 2,3-dehydratase family protein n=1 Tax=Kitasatospora sp. NPDC048239 TaxID=3364046 RepID=UPI0037225F27
MLDRHVQSEAAALTRSVAGTGWAGTPFADWFADRVEVNRCLVERVPLDELRGWRFDPGTGNLAHESGRFFAVEGLHVQSSYGPVAEWRQPIINQDEIGILGLLVREVDGRLHGLVQAKVEPGNITTVQVSPTVQATRSNYTQVHQGARTRYLDLFARPQDRVALVDVLQSEQGSWFLGKRNRNMVVQVAGEVPVGENHHWLPLHEIRRLLRIDALVNMDTRTVLSCLPFTFPPDRARPEDDGIMAGLVRSLLGEGRARSTLGEVLSWFTEAKSRHELTSRRIPLAGLAEWQRTPEEITHREDRHFSIIGVRVEATEREVVGWDQPLFYPKGRGVVAFVVKNIDGLAHLLVHARFQAGLLDRVEMGPTVQCNPDNHPKSRPRFLDEVLHAPGERILFDAVQTEEGGRFYRSENRYLLVDAGEDFPEDVPDDFCWVTAAQLTALQRHGYYVNVEARSLIACLQSLW